MTKTDLILMELDNLSRRMDKVEAAMRALAARLTGAPEPALEEPDPVTLPSRGD